MPTISDILGDPQPQSQLHAALEAGTADLSGDQTVYFTPYVRTILPIDGFVFFLNANLLNPAQLGQHGLVTADPIAIDGSLHYASEARQREAETIVVRRVIFTAQQGLAFLAAAALTVLYVGRWKTDLGTFTFTFSSRSAFYEQAGEWHMEGDAVYPVFEAQLIDGVEQFSDRQVVSNSLPIWLSLNTPLVFPSPLPAPTIPIYPAFLVADNIAPPYAAISIPPEATRALQSVPFFDQTYNRWQLTADRVRVTLYGLRNDQATGFFDYVMQFFELNVQMGLMNVPIIRDGRRPQVELTALAMEKFIDYEVSYYQQTARDIARQMIESVVPTFVISSDPIHPLPTPVV